MTSPKSLDPDRSEAAKAERRKGRGRLSSIDLLPEEAEGDVIWVLEKLRERELPQNVIFEEFSARLIAKDIKPISKSAFSRYAVRKAVQWRKRDQVQRIASELAGSLGTDGADEVTIAVAEMIKVAAFEALEGGNLTTKSIMELSRALSSTVAAQRGSEDYRKQLELRIERQVDEAAGKVEEIGREAGLNAEAVADLRRSFLGVKASA